MNTNEKTSIVIKTKSGIGARVLSDAATAAKLAQSPAPRVTREYIESCVEDVAFTRLSPTVTLCTIVLDNGYSVRGESACVMPENYDQEIGEKYAYEDAFRKLWPLYGFLLAEMKHNASWQATAESAQNVLLSLKKSLDDYFRG